MAANVSASFDFYPGRFWIALRLVAVIYSILIFVRTPIYNKTSYYINHTFVAIIILYCYLLPRNFTK